jgi:hypothetical protein
MIGPVHFDDLALAASGTFARERARRRPWERHPRWWCRSSRASAAAPNRRIRPIALGPVDKPVLAPRWLGGVTPTWPRGVTR